MLALAARYVRVVDAINHRIGRVIMYGIFAMMAILLWSTISKFSAALVGCSIMA